MSRRLKFTLTLGIALLIAGLVLYGALSWSPENPLRFRVVEQGAPIAGSDPGAGVSQGEKKSSHWWWRW